MLGSNLVVVVVEEGVEEVGDGLDEAGVVRLRPTHPQRQTANHQPPWRPPHLSRTGADNF